MNFYKGNLCWTPQTCSRTEDWMADKFRNVSETYTGTLKLFWKHFLETHKFFSEPFVRNWETAGVFPQRNLFNTLGHTHTHDRDRPMLSGKEVGLEQNVLSESLKGSSWSSSGLIFKDCVEEVIVSFEKSLKTFLQLNSNFKKLEPLFVFGRFLKTTTLHKMTNQHTLTGTVLLMNTALYSSSESSAIFRTFSVWWACCSGS